MSPAITSAANFLVEYIREEEVVQFFWEFEVDAPPPPFPYIP